MKDTFAFWQKWLLVVGWIITIFGVMLALFGGTALFAMMNQQIAPVFWGTPATPANVIDFQQWIYGVLGATMAGWGIFITFIAQNAFKRKEKWAWTCVLYGVLVWFVIDTFITLMNRVYFNIVLNVVILIGVILPLIFSRKHFA